MFVYLFYQDVDITIRIMNSPFTLAEYYITCMCVITFKRYNELIIFF